MPFRFVDEVTSADVAFEAWGETREEMFSSCAAALLNTMANAPERVQRLQRIEIRLEHQEMDLLLFSFLQELIFHKDAGQLLLHADGVMIEEREGGFRLTVIAGGEQIDAGRHQPLVDVKAVTLHCFQVGLVDNVWKAVVVLDV